MIEITKKNSAHLSIRPSAGGSRSMAASRSVEFDLVADKLPIRGEDRIQSERKMGIAHFLSFRSQKGCRASFGTGPLSPVLDG
jgi:hypothetical protein